MYKYPSIKKIISGLMLCIFAFSITPKQWIHDIVFNHKDTYTKCTDGNPKAHLHKAGFRCEFDNLIVRSPFVYDNKPVELLIPVLFLLKQVRAIDNVNSTHLFFFELRGPPVIA